MKRNKRKILLIANSSWYIYNFRLPLLREIEGKGFNATIIAPRDEYSNLLKENGFKFVNWKLNRSSINPISEIFSIISLFKIIRNEKPTIIHNFTIKACMYGTLVSRFFNDIYIINAITGLGHLFISDSFQTKILRNLLKPLYKIVFKSKRSFIIFQNFDDKKYLTKIGITDSERSILIKGSGVDINHFRSLEKEKKEFHSPIRLLFPSRIIKEKGFVEVLSAFNSLIKKGENLELVLAGDIDEGNKSSLKKKEFLNLKNNQKITILGHVKNMRDIYERSDIVVLPSWREGLSRALIEAAAMEKPIITTNVPGCKEIIDHGHSGLIVSPKDSASLESAILLLIRNQDLAFKLAKNTRSKVIKEFEVNQINFETLNQYENLMNLI